MITELDVTFTDYALMLECAVFASLIYKQGNRNSLYRFWFTVFLCRWAWHLCRAGRFMVTLSTAQQKN